ncbi:MAG: ABC transporter ATP-binding protein [Spirochaetales bacterium]|nr:ABC transporter ATP-binding protein [Spirochaetales bacterium]
MILQCEQISKNYKAADGRTEISVLKDISFSVKEGESVAILGPSGSGKSTLLHITGLLDYPSSGNVFINDNDVTLIPEKERDILRNRVLGFVFQLHYLLPQCTVMENILIPTLPRANRRSRRNAEKRAEYLIHRAGLDSRIYHRPWQLSGGELQRVAFIRALINSPKILLADEPTGALDHRTSVTLADLLIELNKEEGITLIVVTHSIELAEKMDRGFILKDGILKNK